MSPKLKLILVLAIPIFGIALRVFSLFSLLLEDYLLDLGLFGICFG